MTTDAQILDPSKRSAASRRAKPTQRTASATISIGVSYAELGKLKKKIKIDHDLALKLWASGNHDARILALMIADPQQADAATLDAWVRELTTTSSPTPSPATPRRRPSPKPKPSSGSTSDGEWIARAGWNILGHLAYVDQSLPDSYFERAARPHRARPARQQKSRPPCHEQRRHRHRPAQ